MFYCIFTEVKEGVKRIPMPLGNELLKAHCRDQRTCLQTNLFFEDGHIWSSHPRWLFSCEVNRVPNKKFCECTVDTCAVCSNFKVQLGVQKGSLKGNRSWHWFLHSLSEKSYHTFFASQKYNFHSISVKNCHIW